jgi:hypothetical protein
MYIGLDTQAYNSRRKSATVIIRQAAGACAPDAAVKRE